MSVSSPSRSLNIFLSYAPEDQACFDHLNTHLSILRTSYPTYIWHSSNAGPGDITDQFIETRLHQADLLLLLISADYFASKHRSEMEMKQAIARCEAGQAILIPVLLRFCDWSISPLACYQPLPSNGLPVRNWQDADKAFTDIVQHIHQVLKNLALTQKTPPTPTSQQASLYALPYLYNSFFTDRERLLADLSSRFASPQTHQTPILALSGLGGVGKTYLALEYCYQSSKTYQAILWLNASSHMVFHAEVSLLARQIGLPHYDQKDEQERFEAVKRWLQQQSHWLLVLDHIQDITLLDLLVPLQSTGHVLLTTQMQSTGRRASTLTVPSMDTNAGVLFLLHRAKLLPRETPLHQAPAALVKTAEVMTDAMHGFPLALDQAGAYIEETGCSLSTYLKLYQDQRMLLLDERGQLADDHHASVMKTLKLAFEQVALKNETYLDLLRLMAFFHPDTIPEGLFTNGAQALDEPLQSLAADAFALHQAFAHLLRFSLIHRSADTALLQIDHIVQDVLIDMLTPDQQRAWARQVVCLLNFVFPDSSFGTWDECERYLPQAQHCAHLIDTFQFTIQEGPLLLERLGTYCSHQAFYTEAETYLQQALLLYEKHFHTDVLNIAQTLNSLGLLYEIQARYQEAKIHHRRALTLREQVLGPDDPKIAESKHNLAMVLRDLEEYQEAEQLYQQALAVEERTKGPRHPDVAITLNNLGLIHAELGDYTTSETFYQRALGIYEQSSTPSLDLTYTLNGLGSLAEKRGDYQQAQERYQRALAIRRQLFGEFHPTIAQSLNKIAGIAEVLGNDQEAETWYRQGLAIAEHVLKPDHHTIALFLNNLAFLANKQGQYEQAESLYLRALDIFERKMGPRHTMVAGVLNNLGQLYRKIQKEERAEALLRRSLAIREQTLGSTHPHTAQSLSNLAGLLTTQEKYEEAEPFFQRALDIRLQRFGPGHRDVIHVQRQYATLLDYMNRSEEATKLRQDIQKHIPDESSHEES